MASRLNKFLITPFLTLLGLPLFAQDVPPPPPQGLGAPIDTNIIILLIMGVLLGLYAVLKLRMTSSKSL